MSLLQIRDLTKKIGNKVIVNHLSLDVQKGEILGLLGPNGAGKTTTIRMTVGLISKSDGQVLINGIDTRTHFEKAMKHVGVIVENPDLYKYLSGYDNLVHFSRMTKGVTEQRIREVIGLVGLEHSINDKVGTYSLGMRQRLGLAVVLVHRPSLLLLDEPTNGLDPAGIRELREHLINLARQEEVGVVISSHLMSEMEMMCDRVAILQKGKLVGIHNLSDLVQDELAQVQFEVDRPDLAVQVLQSLMSGAEIIKDQERVRVRIPKARVPEINQKLMDAGIKVFGVNTIKRTLEDKFIEITGGEEH
ncbi:putative ABC transporter ATP-binding protein YhcH [Paenibacillus baekrokdamisoli]|uniref:Putative ABC transporter ATP-binding protein YhcH n=1 Tax=Paenibacillus baekrokdamisoli TaxID=1712516 RepID=A0A3G9J501_9BACL|nr:ABC transporter ATP-binding protein [Paenibacillus baekrokdamisoli]MBB3068612.1 ABC-2 type transport system ATP-binding protein [Paenibacillus baekrokdamisoli]BBH23445.1 putative ABC transporter ATP-binding protein YhcH [Paenibacillus baekrokdamisoli]